jgi:hypothetical protein
MKNLSTGTGLCIAGLCAVAFPFAQKLANVDSEAHAGVQASAIAAVSSAATIQVTPTIVWYGVSPPSGNTFSGEYSGTLFRAWSDGRVEYRHFNPRVGGSPAQCLMNAGCGWQLFSDPAQGLTYRSDINFDAKVDGADLGQLLTDWGDAPRQDIPPSDCPLALINP